MKVSLLHGYFDYGCGFDKILERFTEYKILMDNFTATMNLNLNNSMKSYGLEENILFLYTVILPMILIGCLVTFALNLVIILSFPCITNLSKVNTLIFLL